MLIKGNEMSLVNPEEAIAELNLKKHDLRFTSTVKVKDVNQSNINVTMATLLKHLKKKLRCHSVTSTNDGNILIDSILVKAQTPPSKETQQDLDVLVSWSLQDEDLGNYIMELITAKNLFENVDSEVK